MNKFTRAARLTGRKVVRTDLADIGLGVAHVTTSAVGGVRSKAHEVAEARRVLKLRKEAEKASQNSDRQVFSLAEMVDLNDPQVRQLIQAAAQLKRSVTEAS